MTAISTERKLQAVSDAVLRLDNDERWTTKTSARDALGQIVGPNYEEAVQWCAYGALCKADVDIASAIANNFYDLVQEEVEVVNDNYGYEDVMTGLRALATRYAEEINA